MKFLYFNGILMIFYYVIDSILLSIGLTTGDLVKDIWYVFFNILISTALTYFTMSKLKDFM